MACPGSDTRWFGVGFILIGVAFLIVVGTSSAAEQRRDQAQVDALWRQFILDVETAGQSPSDNRFDCGWMRDVLADKTRSTVLTPGTQPVVVRGNWPSKTVAREYLAELC